MGNKVLVRTPCASATLRYFNVQGVTWNERTKKNVYLDTLRRHGYAVRSRKSLLRKSEQTVGGARKRLAEIAEKENGFIAFTVMVPGHVLVVDRNGNTIVDTAPRQRDKRRIMQVHAVLITDRT